MSNSNRKAKPTRVWQNAILVLFSLLVGFLIVEAGLRLSGLRPGNPFDRLINHYDSSLGYRMIPGMREPVEGPNGIYEVEINSVGLEDGAGFRDRATKKPVFSVFLGDSFVWGYGVDIDNAVSERFEQLIGNDSVNMGMTSFTGPTQYARVLEKYGPELKPQYAFVGFFLGNDFGDTVTFSEWEKSHTTISYPEWVTNRIQGYSPESSIYKIRKSLYNNLALYRFLSEHIDFSGLLGRINHSTAAPKKENDNIMHVHSGALDLYMYKNELPSHIPGFQSQAEIVRTAIKQIIKTGEKENIIPVIFIIPTKEMVYQRYFREEKYKSVVDPRYPALIKMLDDVKMSYIDLLPIFKEKAANGEQLYFKYDGHWNEAGHLLAAVSIRNYLAARADSSFNSMTPNK